MAQTKVSALTALTSPDGAEELLINDSGTSKKITLDNVTENNFTDALKSKLDAVEASADVTDATNVAAAGALMDSELAGIAAVKATTGTFLTADQTKLDGIETSADVTDATNVAAAGALMDSELAGIAAVKATTGTFLSADESKLDGIEASATADQTAGEILTLIEDGVDSVHYKDGSIDEVHIADDAVTADKLANSINTAISANTAKVTNATHTGDVTGSTALTIAVDAVDIAMLSATGTASSSTFLRGDNAWTAVDALPSQSGHAGKYLTTDASDASWATLDTDANTTTKGLYEHEHTIDANYSISSGSNGLSAGPITISSGYSVTVPTGSTWVIV